MGSPIVYVALQQFCETDDRPRRTLREAGFQIRENSLRRRLRREEMVNELQDAAAVLAGVEPYDAELLAGLPKLRCISRCGAGSDAVDLEAARRGGIAVYTTPEEVVEPVAQLTVAMILALARNVPLHLADARAGRWKKRTGALLSEWTVGLIGCGRIGRRVAKHLTGFGARLLVCDPQLSPHAVPAGAALKPLEEVLREADVVSLHANRPAKDGALIGARELAVMKPGSYLVNTARGFLVEESALYEALDRGHLAGAALDVFQAEPEMGPLATHPNVLCTPHVASLTKASRAAMEWRCADNVVRHFASNRSPSVPVSA